MRMRGTGGRWCTSAPVPFLSKLSYVFYFSKIRTYFNVFYFSYVNKNRIRRLRSIICGRTTSPRVYRSRSLLLRSCAVPCLSVPDLGESGKPAVTGHNPPDITPRSESPVQWRGRIKPTKSHIADLKAKFMDWRT